MVVSASRFVKLLKVWARVISRDKMQRMSIIKQANSKTERRQAAVASFFATVTKAVI
jgi:hypothetical protein